MARGYGYAIIEQALALRCRSLRLVGVPDGLARVFHLLSDYYSEHVIFGLRAYNREKVRGQ